MANGDRASIFQTPTFTPPAPGEAPITPGAPGGNLLQRLARSIPAGRPNLPEQPAVVPYRPGIGNALLGFISGFYGSAAAGATEAQEEARRQRAEGREERGLEFEKERLALAEAEGIRREKEFAESQKRTRLQQNLFISETLGKAGPGFGTPENTALLRQFLEEKIPVDDPRVVSIMTRVHEQLPERAREYIAINAAMGMDPDEARMKAITKLAEIQKLSEDKARQDLAIANWDAEIKKLQLQDWQARVAGTLTPEAAREQLPSLRSYVSSILAQIEDLGTRSTGQSGWAAQVAAQLGGGDVTPEDLAQLAALEGSGSTGKGNAKLLRAYIQILEPAYDTLRRLNAIAGLGETPKLPTFEEETTKPPPPTVKPFTEGPEPGGPGLISSLAGAAGELRIAGIFGGPKWKNVLAAAGESNVWKGAKKAYGEMTDSVSSAFGRDDKTIFATAEKDTQAGIRADLQPSEKFLKYINETPEAYARQVQAILEAGGTIDDIRAFYLQRALQAEGRPELAQKVFEEYSKRRRSTPPSSVGAPSAEPSPQP